MVPEAVEGWQKVAEALWVAGEAQQRRFWHEAEVLVVVPRRERVVEVEEGRQLP